MVEKNFDKNQKNQTLHLGGELPSKLVEAFRFQCESRHQQKYGALSAAVKLWIKLPPEVQARLLIETEFDNTFDETAKEIKKESFGQSTREQLHGAIERIKEMVEIERQQPGTIYKVLDVEEQKVLNAFRELVIEPQKKKKKTKRA
jgi:hypothetical protein